jgi:hypothetical protein
LSLTCTWHASYDIIPPPSCGWVFTRRKKRLTTEVKLAPDIEHLVNAVEGFHKIVILIFSSCKNLLKMVILPVWSKLLHKKRQIGS